MVASRDGLRIGARRVLTRVRPSCRRPERSDQARRSPGRAGGAPRRRGRASAASGSPCWPSWRWASSRGSCRRCWRRRGRRRRSTTSSTSAPCRTSWPTGTASSTPSSPCCATSTSRRRAPAPVPGRAHRRWPRRPRRPGLAAAHGRALRGGDDRRRRAHRPAPGGRPRRAAGGRAGGRLPRPGRRRRRPDERVAARAARGAARSWPPTACATGPRPGGPPSWAR